MEITEQDKDYVSKRLVSFNDFPIPGIVFRDFMPCLRDAKAFQILIDALSSSVQASQATLLLAPEARGFIFGCPVAYKLGLPMVCARKPGKLPGDVASESYELEYGHATLEVQADAIKPGSKVYILDDLLATGGTIAALKKLIERLGSEVVCCGFVVELVDLGGREKLGCRVDTIFQF